MLQELLEIFVSDYKSTRAFDGFVYIKRYFVMHMK